MPAVIDAMLWSTVGGGSIDARLSRWTKDFHKEAHPLIDTFDQCSWWKRVWTWQEAALPVEVLLIPETFTELSDSDMLSIKDLQAFTGIGRIAYYTMIDQEDDSEGIDDIKGMAFGWSTTHEISLSRNHCHIHSRYSSTLDGYFSLFEAFAVSPRQCMDPVDHVYGVLGIFQIEIPRKTDPNEVWQLFVTELLKLLTDPKRVMMIEDCEKEIISRYKSDRVRQCNLLTAKNMGEVYQCFIIDK
ncbi:predicted protein [Lichtheimia corymbifera JMRC:FSU:9682]|uniref:Heterokaryon incompatibility domain-containing protein n=1 Tax=Lichtheimia corymbifera JMRC:FSU:9682 TaxID=1263082 RepID=A0A068SBR8_9FUNG|nr:predicted protein [Lichtheimia corymbifera JMRC:FSU:9682]